MQFQLKDNLKKGKGNLPVLQGQLIKDQKVFRTLSKGFPRTHVFLLSSEKGACSNAMGLLLSLIFNI